MDGWLVVSTPLKYMKVSWDDEIPNIWKNKIHVPNHQMIDGYIIENTIVLDPIDIHFLRYNIVDIMDYTGYVVAWYMFNPYFPFCWQN